jgi:hypothetical protein
MSEQAEFGEPLAASPLRRKRSPHEYYIYHDGCDVFARRRLEAPVLTETFGTEQQAHDRVQAIINPDKKRHEDYGPRGFNSPDFQSQISARCKLYVESAYANADQ